MRECGGACSQEPNRELHGMMAFALRGPIGPSDLQPRLLWTYLAALVTLAPLALGNPFISQRVSPLLGLVCVLPSLENYADKGY